ncbi:NAD(P)/FAD-dependent oxidoreductase [Apilactobacillus timberlakei]|uniref:NAD(P)/FAD-dependent oxidoreductase n=1 Tax=Apilactobacillus timberlakei TaxID=2008380 RepID=A0ABY2YSJ7_9LACO|nr:NAD(P)/FAD-dependent oxidoreductase [Apilactobacillus timberlakei]TPR13122.1 NAD(P)/FAD-dependent oxidoreductase [Apilactobacillus timberlakei]TPR14172.1 NAD(P)/FAD-dependent oxidoreductase [Apilactobacillus timberlakei]TPR16425.1 NAD(P)/FAD-dependent oxidoreductase [Apilactobacillus timberlakei]TPR18058.1 NAD(P)/FAD-dependent oxidoreductase [Apilactobacillus timberlakei]TPR19115.1 NAD(P)/FAD-dependent oxidoreductase [Apilactobacillus timberlakei]
MKEVVVLGGGFAGLRACRLLAKSKLNIKITLINNNDYHYDATALHTVSAGTSAPEQITMKIENCISPKVKFIKDTVNNIDHDNKVVYLENNGQIKFDYLFNALGFESETFGTPGADQYGLQIWNMKSGIQNIQKIEDNLKEYRKSKDKSYLSFAVIGGGFTGIELLGELAYQLPKWAKECDCNTNDFTITCIAPSCIPMFDKKLVDFALDYLHSKGVQFIVNSDAKAKEITADGVYYGEDNKFVPAKTTFWTTGVKGNTVIKEAGYDQKRNRVMVNDTMALDKYPDEYLIGDVSAVMDKDTKRPYPTTGQISIQEASIAVENLKARLNNKNKVPFSYKSLGTVCSLGPTMGIAELPLGKKTMKLKGHKVALLKHIVRMNTAFEIAGPKAAIQN